MSHILNFRNWQRVYESTTGTKTALDKLQILADAYGETLYTSEDGTTKSTARFKVTYGAAFADNPTMIANFTEPTPGTLMLKVTINGVKRFEGYVSISESRILKISGKAIAKDGTTVSKDEYGQGVASYSVSFDQATFSDGKGADECTKKLHPTSDVWANLSPIAAVVARAIGQMPMVVWQTPLVDVIEPQYIMTNTVLVAHEVDFGRSNRKYIDETRGAAQ